ncbi:MAG: PAS domain-containing protein [Mycobacteriales bacterium]|nr:PAS domain-containing protein [Frankia sp.]
MVEPLPVRRLAGAPPATPTSGIACGEFETSPVARRANRLSELALDALPLGVVVIDAGNTVRALNQSARQLLGVDSHDGVGAPLRELPPYDTGECLQSVADEARVGGHRARLDRLMRHDGDGAPEVSVEATPVTDGDETVGVCLLVLRRRPRAADELESTNTQLRGHNVELQSINSELRVRTDELNQVALFLESILTSLHGAVVVVDTDLVVRTWNARATELWGIRGREAQGNDVLGLPLGIPRDDLATILRRGLLGESTRRGVEIVRAEGAVATARLTATPLRGAGDSVRGVILLVEAQA